MFAIIQIGSLKYKSHVFCTESNPFKNENGGVRKFTPFSYQKTKLALQYRTKPGSKALTSFRREPHLRDPSHREAI